MKIRKPVALDKFGITSLYGITRMLPGYDKPRKHYGIDIPLEIGTPILSVSGGEIVQIGYQEKGFGIFVVQRLHFSGDDYYFFYCHLNVAVAKIGDVVYPGKILGYSGNTGNTTGPHLHFQITKNGFNAEDYDTITIDPVTMFVDDIELTDYKDHPHREAIQFVIDIGLMTGRSATVFDPDKPITRGEFAVVMKRFIDMKGAV